MTKAPKLPSLWDEILVAWVAETMELLRERPSAQPAGHPQQRYDDAD
jgi:hypothetical protein